MQSLKQNRRGDVALGSFVWLGLFLAPVLFAGCAGSPDTPTPPANAGSNGASWVGSATSAGLSEEQLEEIHFANVWRPVVNLKIGVEQAWLAGGNVYLTTADGSDDYKLLKIDGETGLVRWSFDLPLGKLEKQPHFYRYPKELRDTNPDELWLVQNDTIYCLDDAEGAENYHIECKFPISTAIASAQDHVFVGSWNKRMYAISKSKRLEEWSHITEAPITASAEVGQLNVFFGSEDNHVYCLNIGGGYQPGKSWAEPTGGKIVSTPLFDSSRVYVGSWDYKVYCFDEYQGFQRWTYPTGAPVVTPLFSYKDYLFAVSEDDRGGRKSYKLIALGRNDGLLKWERADMKRVIAADAFNCYALDDENQLHALRLTDGEGAWTLDVRGFKFVLSQDAERGRRRDLEGRIYMVSGNGVIQAIRPRR